ncbi:MAG: shikimate kinase [Verrucomicrobiia bacterium]
MTAGRTIHNIALIGFMASGKSTVGRTVAERLGFSFVDTDELVEQRAGKSVATIFAEDGEEKFREYERQVAAELVHRRNTVIATGGGFGADPSNLASLKTHALVVCLWAPPEVLQERARRLENRPLLQVPDPLGRIRELLAKRTPVYQQADVLINTAGRHNYEVAQIVLRHFQSTRTHGAGAGHDGDGVNNRQLPPSDNGARDNNQ